MLKYQDNGWPVTTTREVTAPPTPEELSLDEALLLLGDLTTIAQLLLAQQLGNQQDELTLERGLARLTAIVEDVRDVVSDYHHLHARVSELEDELDDRDEKIAALEERVIELDETLNGEG
jgi:peptidoglycan hydrolase CwlO-like protein